MSEKEGWIGDESSKLKIVIKYSLVVFLMSLFFFINIIPIQIGNIGEVRPQFLMIAIFYWTIFRPSLVPPVLVFIIGLLMDLLLLMPLGITALAFISVQWLVKVQRTFLLGQGFFLIWWGFAIIIFGASAINWALFCLLKLSLVPFQPILISAILSAILFPLATVPLYYINKLIPRQQKIAGNTKI